MSAMKPCDNGNVFPSPPTCTHAQIGDNHAHARTAKTRPFLLLCLFGPGNKATVAPHHNRHAHLLLHVGHSLLGILHNHHLFELNTNIQIPFSQSRLGLQHKLWHQVECTLLHPYFTLMYNSVTVRVILQKTNT